MPMKAGGSHIVGNKKKFHFFMFDIIEKITVGIIFFEIIDLNKDGFLCAISQSTPFGERRCLLYDRKKSIQELDL